MKKTDSNKAPLPDKSTDCKTGHRCEKWAQMLLMLKGYIPVSRNYVTGRGTGAGEVDLIMRKGRLLVFIEVKKRATFEKALHAVTIENQARVIRASAAFLQRNPKFSDFGIRYDAVLFAPKRMPRHIKDAWRVL